MITGITGRDARHAEALRGAFPTRVWCWRFNPTDTRTRDLFDNFVDVLSTVTR